MGKKKYTDSITYLVLRSRASGTYTRSVGTKLVYTYSICRGRANVRVLLSVISCPLLIYIHVNTHSTTSRSVGAEPVYTYSVCRDRGNVRVLLSIISCPLLIYIYVNTHSITSQDHAFHASVPTRPSLVGSFTLV